MRQHHTITNPSYCHAEDVGGPTTRMARWRWRRSSRPIMHPKVPAARLIDDLSGVSDEELDRIEREGGEGDPGEDSE